MPSQREYTNVMAQGPRRAACANTNHYYLLPRSLYAHAFLPARAKAVAERGGVQGTVRAAASRARSCCRSAVACRFAPAAARLRLDRASRETRA